MRAIAEFVELARRVVDPRVLPFAMLFGLVLATGGLSLLALFRAKALVRETDQRAKAAQERCDAVLESLRENQNSLAAELRELRQQTPMTVAFTPLKAGLNLTKRSQALRMHRRGDPPDRIAVALDIPLQEVDLLLKVHRIVISNI